MENVGVKSDKEEIKLFPITKKKDLFVSIFSRFQAFILMVLFVCQTLVILFA